MSKFKIRTTLIAVGFLVALLALPSLKVSASQPLNTTHTVGEIQSRIPAATLQCDAPFVPNEDGTKCVCPEGKKPKWNNAGCEDIDPGDRKRPIPGSSPSVCGVSSTAPSTTMAYAFLIFASFGYNIITIRKKS
jgi:hypothetical protein